MDKQSIKRFAFAVNEQNRFEKKHFGDADKYLIFEWDKDGFIKKEEALNRFRDYDETQAHGSKKKGGAIIGFLKEKGVKVIVSMQFGKNITLVNQHFVPIIINQPDTSHAIESITKHIKWIEDEFKINQSGFNVFSINNGILKRKIDKA